MCQITAIYSRMHRNIVPHPVRLGPDNLELLADATFVFLCLDAGDAKSAIIAELERLDLPFVDVGIGRLWDLDFGAAP